MRKTAIAAVATFFMAGLPAAAQNLDLSHPTPKPRPERVQVTVASSSFSGVLSTPRPKPRPAAFAPAEIAPVQIAPESVVQLAAVRMTSPLPKPRPGNLDTSGEGARPGKGFKLFKAALRAPASQVPVRPTKGSVCGDPSIRGQTLAPVVSKVNGCGVDAPVQVTEVAGVRLSQPSTIDCPTAIALKTWVESSLQPACKGQVAQLKIAGHYVCRGRNNKRGAKISEHGRGKALDVSGLVLTDGSGLSIEAHYRKIKPLQAAYKGACGIFGTTLGPGSDGYHEDHLHFDTAKHRNGAYCR